MAEAMDGAGEDNGNRERAAFIFMQPPILQSLFEQLPLEDLAKCRLVNKLWYGECLPTWRSKAPLKFEKEGLVSTREDGSRWTTPLGEFLDQWESSSLGSSCPFKKFNINSWDFKAGDMEQSRFLQLVGGHATSLTFEDCHFDGTENFRRIIYTSFPKLKHLKLHNCQIDNMYWYDSPEEPLAYEEPTYGFHGLSSLHISRSLPHSILDILSHFHKLKSLRMEPDDVAPLDLLESISAIRAQDKTKLPLKNFDVQFDLELGTNTAYYMEELKMIEQLKLPLQRLEIKFTIFQDDNNGDIIRDMLRCHSSTMTHLEFFGTDNFWLCKSFPFEFSFDNLKQLVLSSSLTDNFNYLKYMPKLRVLKVEYGGLSQSKINELFSNSDQLEIGDWSLGSLTDLTVHFKLSAHNLGKLMRWMPNVEELLGLELDDVKFSMLCDNWKNMKKLWDYGTELTDAGVIGIGNADDAERAKNRNGPNITKLKNLTSFHTCSSKLTSASVYDGFLKLANLEYIRVGRSREIDDEAKAAIERRKIRLYIP